MKTSQPSRHLLETKLRRRDELIAQLRSQMDADTREHDKRIEELSQQRDEMKRERDDMQRERDNTQRERDAAKKMVSSLKWENSHLKTELEDANQELEDTTRKLEDTIRELEEVRQELSELQELAGGGDDGVEDEEVLVDRLSQYFTNENAAKRFLAAIRGRSDAEVARTANKCWRSGAILKTARKTHLWRVLHEAKLYRALESNWNAMVTFSPKTWKQV